MHGRVVWQSLKSFCHIYHFMHSRITVVNALKLRVHLKSLVNRDIKLLRHHLCKPVSLCIWEIQRLSD